MALWEGHLVNHLVYRVIGGSACECWLTSTYQLVDCIDREHYRPRVISLTSGVQHFINITAYYTAEGCSGYRGCYVVVTHGYLLGIEAIV